MGSLVLRALLVIVVFQEVLAKMEKRVKKVTVVSLDLLAK